VTAGVGEGQEGNTTAWTGEGEENLVGSGGEDAVEGGGCWVGREGGVVCGGMEETACEEFAGVVAGERGRRLGL